MKLSVSTRASEVYAIEDTFEHAIGPRLSQWSDVADYVDAIVNDEAFVERYGVAAATITIGRRSRSARASVAVPSHGLIALRDGSWNSITILHELAHLVTPKAEDHNDAFVTELLWLVRQFCGFDAFGALRSAFIHRGILEDNTWTD